MGFYRRRHPERSDYYRLHESVFEEFARNWAEDFESRYGFLRKEVQSAVFVFVAMSERTGMSVSQVTDEVLYADMIEMQELDAPG